MAAILAELAGNAATPPAARWRAAVTLAELGAPYREGTLAHLYTIMTDDRLPPSARIEGARALAEAHPRHLHTAADTLRAIAYAPRTNPAGRRHALTALGSLATVRWRAAYAMVQLRRDTATETGHAVRQIIRDTNTPWHIRCRAACALARWSPLCREEARQVLQEHAAGGS